MKNQLAFLVSIWMVVGALNASAQIPEPERLDPLFPKEGGSSVSIWTGFPYAAIGEYAYAFNDRLTVGLIGGVTFTTKAIGLRPRILLAEPSDNLRVYVKAVALYYPPSDDSHYEPWLLAWPSANAEWTFGSDTRLWLGAGLVAAGCAHNVLGIEDEAMDHGGQGFRGGLWNDLQIGFSHSFGEKITIQSEVAVIMKGYHLANDPSLGLKHTDLYWDNLTPLILSVGASYAF
jgi:hypothetical protein